MSWRSWRLQWLEWLDHKKFLNKGDAGIDNGNTDYSIKTIAYFKASWTIDVAITCTEYLIFSGLLSKQK